MSMWKFYLILDAHNKHIYSLMEISIQEKGSSLDPPEIWDKGHRANAGYWKLPKGLKIDPFLSLSILKKKLCWFSLNAKERLIKLELKKRYHPNCGMYSDRLAWNRLWSGWLHARFCSKRVLKIHLKAIWGFCMCRVRRCCQDIITSGWGPNH